MRKKNLIVLPVILLLALMASYKSSGIAQPVNPAPIQPLVDPSLPYIPIGGMIPFYGEQLPTPAAGEKPRWVWADGISEFPNEPGVPANLVGKRVPAIVAGGIPCGATQNDIQLIDKLLDPQKPSTDKSNLLPQCLNVSSVEILPALKLPVTVGINNLNFVGSPNAYQNPIYIPQMRKPVVGEHHHPGFPVSYSHPYSSLIFSQLKQQEIATPAGSGKGFAILDNIRKSAAELVPNTIAMKWIVRIR